MDGVAASSGTDRLIFSAVVKPHRSLSRRGVLLVIAGMLACSAIVSSMMFLLGAWPVIGFNGADILLAVFLFWLNMREERAGTVPRLLFSTRGRSYEVAKQLGEAEKRDLAAALTGALYRWRNPRFE